MKLKDHMCGFPLRSALVSAALSRTPASTLNFGALWHRDQRGGSPRHSILESTRGTQLDPIAAAVKGGIILSWESCLDAA